MKKLIPLSWIFLCHIVLMHSLHAQWIQANSPASGDVRAFAASGMSIFAATKAGVYVTTNNGSNWRAVNTGLTNLDVKTLTVFGTSLFAGTYGGGVFLSSNGGLEWKEVNQNLSNLYVNALSVAGDEVVAGTDDGLFRFNADSVLWHKIEPSPNYAITVLAPFGRNLLIGSGNGVFVYMDDQINFASSGIRGLGLRCIGAALCVDSIFYVGKYGELYTSRDSAATWTRLNTGINTFSIVALAAKGKYLYAVCGSAGIYRSPDAGATWEYCGLKSGLINTIAAIGPMLLAGSMTSGILLSTDDGATWNTINTGLPDVWASSLTASDTMLFASSAAGIFRSSNEGKDWFGASKGLNNLRVSSLYTWGKKIFAGADDGLYRSEDQGANWTCSGLQGTIVNGYANSGSELYVSTDEAVFHSSDSGSTWENIGLGLHECRSMTVMGSRLLVTNYAGVNLSGDGGATWNLINNGLPGKTVFSLAIIGERLLAAMHGGIYCFHFEDSTWGLWSDELQAGDWYQLKVIGSTLFAATKDGVFASVDEGMHWRNTGLVAPGIEIYRLAAFKDDLIVGTTKGIWKHSLSDITKIINYDSAVQPDHFSLEQNFPNPFNPTTTIVFNIPKRSHVQLTIFDALGRIISMLVSEDLSAGTYTRRWDASDYPSGVYFYRLHADSYSETKRLLLVK